MITRSKQPRRPEPQLAPIRLDRPKIRETPHLRTTRKTIHPARDQPPRDPFFDELRKELGL